MHVTETSTTTTTAAVAPQGAPVATKRAKATTKAKATKRAARGRKTAKKPAARKTVTKDATTPPKVRAANRAASEKAQVLDMLRAREGATLDALMEATGWQRHTCRGFLSIAGKSTHVVSEKTETGRTYRIAK